MELTLILVAVIGFLVAILAHWIGYCEGVQHVQQQAVNRKLGSWKKKVASHDTHNPILSCKFTWVGEEEHASKP